MKVLPGASPSSSLTNKNIRYMEVNIQRGQIQKWVQFRPGSRCSPAPFFLEYLVNVLDSCWCPIQSQEAGIG